MGPDLEPLKLDFRAGKIVAGEEQWNSTVAQNETRKSCGLMRFELEQNIRKPTINEPFSITKARKKMKNEERTKKDFKGLYGVYQSSARIVIDCPKKEYLHYEGMRYPSFDIPLITDEWMNRKSRNDWFTICRRNDWQSNPSFDSKIVFSWQECMDHIDDIIVINLMELECKSPTIIQAKSFKSFGCDRHLFIVAETGSGKTVAYIVPIIKDLLKKRREGKKARAIVLVPTKILKMQLGRMVSNLIKNTDLHLIYSADCVTLSSDWDIFVSTPATATKILKEMTNVDYLVIDEADILLDDSFVDVMVDFLNIVKIRYSATNKTENEGARVIFSSATCPKSLLDLAENVVDKDCLQFVSTKRFHHLMPHVIQKFIRVTEADKIKQVEKIINDDLGKSKGQTMIFCKDVKTCYYVTQTLQNLASDPFLMGGTMDIKQLEVMNKAFIEEPRIFVATDVASRGLDLPLLRHVINYDFPRHMVDYIYRSGRVGRISSKYSCKVTSFIHCPWEIELIRTIEKCVRFDIPIPNVEVNIAGKLIERKKNEER